MEDTDKVLLGVIAVASVATAINTGVTAGTRPPRPTDDKTEDGNDNPPEEKTD